MKRNQQQWPTLVRCALFVATILAGSSALALPTSVYVQEEAMVNAGTSYLKLPLLQANGSKIDQIWDVYVGSFDIGVATTPHGPWSTALAFCVDPWNWSGSGAMPYFKQDFAQLAATASDTFDLQNLGSHKSKIEALYSNYYQGTLGNTAKSAAFQLALWEIVSDNAVQAVSGTDAKIWADGQALLSQLNASHFQMGSQHYDLTAYYVQRNEPGFKTLGQNYLVATAVPEPASIALLGIGLVGLVGARRRAA